MATSRDALEMAKAANNAEVVIEQFNVNEDVAGRWMANLLLRNRGPGRAFDLRVWLTDPDGTRIPTPSVAPRTSRSRSGRGA